MTKEEMLDIYLAETGIDKFFVKQYGSISRIVESTKCNKPLILKRKALYVVTKVGDFATKEEIYENDKFPLVTDEDEKEQVNGDS